MRVINKPISKTKEKEQLAAIMGAVNSAQDTLEVINDKIVKAELDKEKIEIETKKFIENLALLEERIKERTNDLVKVEKEYQTKSKELASKIDVLLIDKNKAVKSNEELSLLNNSKMKEYLDLELKIQDAKNKLASQETDSKNQIKLKDKEIANLSNKLSKILKDIQSAEDKINSLNLVIEDKNKIISSLNEDISKIRDLSDKNRKILEDIKKEISTSAGKVEAHELKLLEGIKKLDEIDKEVLSKREQMLQLVRREQRIARMTDELRKLYAKAGLSFDIN